MDFIDLRCEEEIQLYNSYSEQLLLQEEEETWYPDVVIDREPYVEIAPYGTDNRYLALRLDKG